MIDIGALAQPIIGLISTFGSGVMGDTGPSALLRSASVALEDIHGTGRTGMYELEGAWLGGAAVEALTVGSAVQTALGGSADRGNSLAEVLDLAAGDVRGGVVRLEEILRSFVATVTAAVPLLATPAGQTMVIAAAVEHLNRALAVVAEVRGRLGEHATSLTALAPLDLLAAAPTLASSIGPAIQSVVDDTGASVSSAFATSPAALSSATPATDSGNAVNHTSSVGTGQYGTSSTASFSNASLGSSGGPPSGAMPSGEVGDWIQQALEILRGMGYDTSNIDPRDLAMIIAHESAGNPHAINLWDSNAAAGTPSKGIMQTIDPTFHAYKAPGHGDIWNPVDNIVAATRYAIDRYGGVGNVPGVTGVNSGGGYVGY